MLKYTGHPFIDVGVATIVAISSHQEKRKISLKELNSDQRLVIDVADYLQSHVYFDTILGSYAYANAIRGFLNWLFPNSPYTNISARKPYQAAEKAGDQQAMARAENSISAYTERMLRSFQQQADARNPDCFFCGAGTKANKAVELVYRAKFPLLNAATAGNFGAKGVPGLPICGYCLLAVYAMPLGAMIGKHRLLIVHSESNDVTEEFARLFFATTSNALHFLKQHEGSEMPKLENPKTHLTASLLNILGQSERKFANRDISENLSMSCYYFSNDNRGASIRIFELPTQVVSFLREVTHPFSPASPAWKHYVYRAWVRKRKEFVSGIDAPALETSDRRNVLYEDLLDAQRAPGLFVQRHLCPHAEDLYVLAKGESTQWFDRNRPPESPTVRHRTQVVEGNWQLIHIFLGKVMEMDKQRIDAIEYMGDRLADYITQKDRRMLRELHFARKYDDFRLSVVNAVMSGWSPDTAPLLGMRDFTRVFEEKDDRFEITWRLGRDLLLIRICEQLHHKGWFNTNADLVAEIESEEQDRDEEE